MIPQLSTLFLREIDALRREVEAYPTDEAMWQEVPGLPNSGGTLVLHLIGNLRHFVGAALGGSRYVRNRDEEFARRGVPRTELLAALVESRREVGSALARLTELALDAPFPMTVLGRRMETRMFVLHLLSHLAFHLGQIDYHRRVVTGDAQSIGAVPLSNLGEEADS